MYSFFACEFKQLPQVHVVGCLSKREKCLCISAVTVSALSDWPGTRQAHLVSRNVKSSAQEAICPAPLPKFKGCSNLFEMTIETWTQTLYIFSQCESSENFYGPCYFRFQEKEQWMPNTEYCVTWGHCLKFLLVTHLLALGLSGLCHVGVLLHPSQSLIPASVIWQADSEGRLTAFRKERGLPFPAHVDVLVLSFGALYL